VTVAVRIAAGGAWPFAEDPGDLRGRAARLDAGADAPVGPVLEAALDF
jgi:hypothetical protein